MSNKVKVPGGAFYLGDGLTVDPVTRTVSAGGGDGGSVPKPLTFDYMPEGYPKKTAETVTLMDEQEVEFVFNSESGVYIGALLTGIEIAVGQTYRVNWDGTEYECVGEPAFNGNASILGNLSLAGLGVDTGEPFLYLYDNNETSGSFATLDTSASHTISVKTTEETVTPIAEEYLPKNLATKSDAEAAQSTADVALDRATTAQTTAETAQTTAETAQTTADAALPKSGGEMSGVIKSSSNIEFPRKYSSDASPIKGLVIGSNIDSKVLTNQFTSNVDPSIFSYIETIVTYLDGIIIYRPNKIANENTITIAAEGVRLDFLKNIDKKPITISAKDIILQSSTAGSTKKFKITVDDSGTISATEVTA